MDLPVKVEAYSGARFGERPRAFFWRGERIEIQEVEKEWRSPLGEHFQVRTAQGRRYQLVYDQESDQWFLSSPFKEGAPWQT
ncbi:MAG: hypothetical protein HYX86_04445 [Chloroflexi bacterium]|nr:hypothetical protein [Chloroflexota bacterium]